MTVLEDVCPKIIQNGRAFKGFKWEDDIDLPTNKTIKNDDGSTSVGDAIDWTGSVFTVLSSQTDDIEIVQDMTSTPATVQLHLTGEQTMAIFQESFNWWLFESGVINGPVFWRTVDLERVQ